MAFNPNATIKEVTPTEIKPGDRIDLDVIYSAGNPDMYWNTCIVIIRKDTGAVVCKTHGMIGATDSHIVEPIVCGTMPEGPVELEVQIWGHDDYYSSPPEVCG